MLSMALNNSKHHSLKINSHIVLRNVVPAEITKSIFNEHTLEFMRNDMGAAIQELNILDVETQVLEEYGVILRLQENCNRLDEIVMNYLVQEKYMSFAFRPEEFDHSSMTFLRMKRILNSFEEKMENLVVEVAEFQIRKEGF